MKFNVTGWGSYIFGQSFRLRPILRSLPGTTCHIQGISNSDYQLHASAPATADESWSRPAISFEYPLIFICHWEKRDHRRIGIVFPF